MTALVSVIVPTYNVELYDSRCIESVLAQSYPNWELILINDGSTDNSGEICNDYARKYQKIRVINQENKGVSAARNTGIEAAKGAYLLFVDPDDWIAPNMLEEMLTKGHGSELTVCGYTIVLELDDGSKQYEERLIWSDRKDAFEPEDVYYELLCKTAVVWNKLFRRDIIGTIRFQEELRYGEDAIFVTEVLDNVHSAVFLPESLYYYFKNRKGNVVSASLDNESWLYLDNVASIYQFLKKRGAGVFGIRRIYIAVDQVYGKISYSERKRYRPFIKKCGMIMRKTSLHDQIKYALDRRFIKSRKKQVQLFLDIYLPMFGFYSRKLKTR